MRRIWTEEEDAALRRMLAEGQTFTQIGIKLGCTKNAAIGRSHRIANVRHPGRQKPPTPAKVVSFQKLFVAKPAKEPRSRKLKLHQLDANTCRWPGENAPFTFCGHLVFPGTPYCEAHARRSYQPPRVRAA